MKETDMEAIEDHPVQRPIPTEDKAHTKEAKEQTRLLQKMSRRQERGISVSKAIAIAEFALLGVLVVVFVLLVPMFLKTVTRVQETMDNVDALVAHAETSMSELTDLAKDTDVLINENEEAIKVALENFNSVDFESLNHSISSLAEIMEPVVEIVKILRE